MPEFRVGFQDSRDFNDAVDRAAAEQRIDPGYWDIFHRYNETSRDIRVRLLAALGWDTSSRETIDAEREKRFRTEFASLLPATVVLSESDRNMPVTLPAASESQRFDYQLELEEGEAIAGTIEFASLPFWREVSAGSDVWICRQFPIPEHVPPGYHRLLLSTPDARLSATAAVILCPERAYIPEHLQDGGRSAGFNVTLYGLRSARNWGCGDFTDLRALAVWAHNAVGFSFIGLNPLHALHNRIPYNTSPYLPLSIFYKNLIYIDVESLPEFTTCNLAQRIFRGEKLQKTLADMRAAEFVCYHECDRLKRRFLKMLFREFRRGSSSRWSAFEDYCEREGEMLHHFALYCALDEVLHKQDRNRWTWQHWPADYQDPHTDASAAFAQEHRRLVQFYKYIQFVIDEQLSAAQRYLQEQGLKVGLYHDLALATDSCGADLWAYRHFFVNGCRVGAPPDDFSPNGQDWAFPPPNSDSHYADGYRLYRESIRKIVRYGGALRIDHVMRLFRLFWIPEAAKASQGTYVRDRAIDLMRILALESVRSRNIVIGEDLGTVTDEIRDMLARFGILSYRLFYFEKHRDETFKRLDEYPRQALVASSTHDLPTLCGFWLGRDIEARRQAGLADDHGAWEQQQSRHREKQQMLDVLHSENLLPSWYPRGAHEVPEVDGPLHNAIVAFLARVPSMLLLLNQEDLTKETEQQNLPGSTSQYPNWQRKMRAALEDLTSEWAPYAAMFRSQLSATDRAART